VHASTYHVAVATRGSTNRRVAASCHGALRARGVGVATSTKFELPSFVSFPSNGSRAMLLFVASAGAVVTSMNGCPPLSVPSPTASTSAPVSLGPLRSPIAPLVPASSPLVPPPHWPSLVPVKPPPA